MIDDFDIMIQPEELIDEDTPPVVDIVFSDDDEEIEDAYDALQDELEQLIATHYLELIADDLEELEELSEAEDIEEDFIPENIDWEYELETSYDLEDEDFIEISKDFFDMLNED